PAQHAVLLARHRLHREGYGGAGGDGGGPVGGHVHRRVQGVPGAGGALHGGDVGTGPDDPSDARGEGGDASGVEAADDRVALPGADLQHGGAGGQPLALLHEDLGDLPGDGALQDVAAPAVGEDGGRGHGGRHGSGQRPHGRGGHRHDGDGQHQPTLGAGEAHGEVEF